GVDPGCRPPPVHAGDDTFELHLLLPVRFGGNGMVGGDRRVSRPDAERDTSKSNRKTIQHDSLSPSRHGKNAVHDHQGRSARHGLKAGAAGDSAAYLRVAAAFSSSRATSRMSYKPTLASWHAYS